MSLAALSGWRIPHPAVPVDPFADYVSLLLIGQELRDQSQYQHALTNTGVVMSSAQAKFGAVSMYFDGASWLEFASHTAMNMGNGDWTVDGWAYATAVVGSFQGFVAAKSRMPDGGYVFRGNADSSLTIGGPQYADRGSTGATFLSGEWVFFAAERQGTRTRLFVNGLETDNAPDLNPSLVFDLGNGGTTVGYADFGFGAVPSAPTQFFTGWIDGLRVTKGVARYDGSFDVPTAPFPPVVP